MEEHSIDFSNKSLNYVAFKDLFEELQRVENVDSIIIDIKYEEMKKNDKKKITKSFGSIIELIEYVKDLKKIDEINVILYSKDNKIELKYDYYTEGWRLEYKTDNNFTKAIICVLNNCFRPNFIKKLVFYNTKIIWIIWMIVSSGTLIAFKNLSLLAFSQKIQCHIIILTFFVLLGFSIYKIIRRRNPYTNNEFWETHKVEIIQNIIFYFLGVVTPYVISWTINAINK